MYPRLQFTVASILSVFVLAVFLSFPVVGVAQGPQNPPSITNPLAVGDIPSLINIVVEAARNIGYFVIVLFIIYSGFLFVQARGDEAKLSKAKDVFKWTIVGAAVLLGAQVLSIVIKGTVDSLG